MPNEIELTKTQLEMAAGAQAVAAHQRGRQLDEWQKRGVIDLAYHTDQESTTRGPHLVTAKLANTSISTVYDKNFPSELFIANIALAINAGQASEPRLTQSMVEEDHRYLQERARKDELRKHLVKW